MSACIYDDYPSPPEGTDTMLANASRIARLPDLETAYLAQAEEIARLRTALAEIAGQKLVAEMERPHDADFEVGYDTCVSTARAALGETK